MYEFIRDTFYVLLFLGIYGTALLLFVASHYVNKWCDKGEEERLRLLAALEEAELRDKERKALGIDRDIYGNRYMK